jgi:L-amino acid N-acyltransferase YncA
MVEADNLASLHIAEAVGFADTGAREFSGECRLVVQP